MKYHKKFREKVFMLLISRIKENKVKNEKDTCKNILRFYKKFNKIINYIIYTKVSKIIKS